MKLFRDAPDRGIRSNVSENCSPLHVLRAALVGADICTMSFEVLSMPYDHPLTDTGIDMFLQDWKKVPR